MISKKDRRHSGRVSPRLIKGIKQKELINEGLEPQEYWDEWKDYRDGFRYNKDRKHLRSRFMTFAENLNVKKWNRKLKRLILRRRARKMKNKRIE